MSPDSRRHWKIIITMDKLKGKTILIGKEPGEGRLLITIEGNGKKAAIGAPGSVPDCVSRCRQAEGVAHVKITVDRNGNMVLTNMKPANVTFVNGKEIISKHVAISDTVELGKDHFRLNLPVVIETAKKMTIVVNPGSKSHLGTNPNPGPLPNPNPKPVKKFNISHLEREWDRLQDKKKEIRAKQKKINLVRSGCGLFTMCAMPCIFMFGPVGYVLTGIGIIGNLYSFIGLKNDNTGDVLEQLNEEFQDRYVCPNPDCNKFLGNISYKLLKKQHSMHCPFCKCEYIEK